MLITFSAQSRVSQLYTVPPVSAAYHGLENTANFIFTCSVFINILAIKNDYAYTQHKTIFIITTVCFL